MNYISYILTVAVVALVSSFQINENHYSPHDNTHPHPLENIQNQAKNLHGAWTTAFTNSEDLNVTITMIITDGYFVRTYYNKEAKRFDDTYGGSWSADATAFSYKYEFSFSDSSKVGNLVTLGYTLKDETLTFKGDDRVWKRVDKANSGVLTGAWLFTGRQKDGEISRSPESERKTMKILSDSRFQWIAYHTGTGEFFGTGGGTYEAKDGTYTENIEFFSRNNSRVGASLSFNYELQDNEWHHTGSSSKGDELYEIWAPRAKMK